MEPSRGTCSVHLTAVHDLLRSTYVDGVVQSANEKDEKVAALLRRQSVRRTPTRDRRKFVLFHTPVMARKTAAGEP